MVDSGDTAPAGPPDFETLQKWLKNAAAKLSADPHDLQAHSDFNAIHGALMTMRSDQNQADVTAAQPGAVGSALVGFGHGASLGMAGGGDYLDAARQAHGGLTNGMDALGTGITSTIGAMSGLGTLAAPLAFGARGAIDPSISGSRPLDAALMGGGAAAAEVGAYGAGRLLKPVFGPTVNRITQNIVKLLSKRGGGNLPGLQTLSEMVGREAAPEVASGARAPTELASSDIEELHHMLNGEPTMAGYRTITGMIEKASPAEAGAPAARTATLATSGDAAQVQQQVREATINKMQNAFLHDEKIFPGKAKFDAKNMDVARKLAEKYVDQAATQAEHIATAPSVVKPDVNPLIQTPEEAAATLGKKTAKGRSAEAAQIAYQQVIAGGGTKEAAIEAAKRAAGFSGASGSF